MIPAIPPFAASPEVALPRPSPPARGILAAMRRFGRAREGVAAVEFALVATFFLLPAYLGVVETTDAIMASRKAKFAARSLVDITAQSGDIRSNAQIDAIFEAARAAIRPLDPERLQMTVASVVRVNGVARVAWSRAKGTGATPPAVGSTVNEAANLLSADGDSVIMARSVYNHTPMFRYVLKDATMKLGSDAVFMIPRNAREIKCCA